MKNFGDPGEALTAAQSLDTSSKELELLAASSWDFVHVAVAGNPNATPETLSRLVPVSPESWNEQALIEALAQNPVTPPDTLDAAAQRLIPLHRKDMSHRFPAAVALCCNPKTNFESVSALLDPDITRRSYRKVVARETRRRDVLELLANERCGTVSSRARRTLEEFNQQKSTPE